MTFIIEGRRGQAQTDPGAMEVLTMLYDFDKPTDRRHSNSLKWDIAEGELPMWVADMDFETAPAVRKALEEGAKGLELELSEEQMRTAGEMLAS